MYAESRLTLHASAPRGPSNAPRDSLAHIAGAASDVRRIPSHATRQRSARSEQRTKGFAGPHRGRSKRCTPNPVSRYTPALRAVRATHQGIRWPTSRAQQAMYAESRLTLHAGAPRGVERETGFEPATNSLEGCDSTPELLPRAPPRPGRWWRRMDSNHRRGFARQIYSLLPLTARPHLRQLPPWSRHPDSNRGPTAYKAVALPTELCRPSPPRHLGAMAAPRRRRSLRHALRRDKTLAHRLVQQCGRRGREVQRLYAATHRQAEKAIAEASRSAPQAARLAADAENDRAAQVDRPRWGHPYRRRRRPRNRDS